MLASPSDSAGLKLTVLMLARSTVLHLYRRILLCEVGTSGSVTFKPSFYLSLNWFNHQRVSNRGRRSKLPPEFGQSWRKRQTAAATVFNQRRRDVNTQKVYR